MLEQLLGSSQTLLYSAIAFGSLLFIAGSFLFGGDSGHEHDHDAGHHGVDGGDADASVSFFSPKVFFTFTLGFGAAAAIASAYGVRNLWCIMIGFGCGFALAGAAYGMLAMIYRQQATSTLVTNNALGKSAQVVSAIPKDGAGEVGLEIQGQYQIYLARARLGENIPKGARVKVVENHGGELLVEPLSS
jgi:membrane protein implicated in regulation of membrane protease activity